VRSAGNHAGEHVRRLEILDAGSREGSAALARFDVTTPTAPGAFAFAPAPDPAGLVLIAKDPAGFMYGILELRDRIAAGEPLSAVFRAPHARLESPATPVRAIGRAFVSARHDHGWFRSAEFWDSYLSMLAANRFNQLDLALGMGYNFPLHVTDSYFLFAYPFFLKVPGYSVEVSGISPDERRENLDCLKLASREAARRGIAFHLGLWTHSFENADSPGVNHVITGVTSENHAAYCRDALTLLLEECPDITGVTFRTHGESGVSEGSSSFWGSLILCARDGCGGWLRAVSRHQGRRLSRRGYRGTRERGPGVEGHERATGGAVRRRPGLRGCERGARILGRPHRRT
jgi:hypothetical protein